MSASPRITEQSAPFFHLTDAEVLERSWHIPRGHHVLLTRERAHASGTDAGNRNMRDASRIRWNDEDFNIAAETTMRFTVFGGFLPPECYEQCTGQPFPYVLGKDGSWIARRPDVAEAQAGNL